MRGIFPVPYDLFTTTFIQDDIDPRWLHYGVFEYAPTPERSSWVYVTSGVSTPWDDDEPNPDGVSGLGSEFVFESTIQGDWAIRRLWQLMAYQILLFHGRYPGQSPLAAFDRLPLRSSIWDGASAIQTLMLAPPDAVLGIQRLESWSFSLVHVVGITEAEAAFARERGDVALLDQLRAEGAFPVTDPARQSIRIRK